MKTRNDDYYYFNSQTYGSTHMVRKSDVEKVLNEMTTIECAKDFREYINDVIKKNPKLTNLNSFYGMWCFTTERLGLDHIDDLDTIALSWNKRLEKRYSRMSLNKYPKEHK